MSTVTVDLDLELQLREEPQEGFITTLYGRAIPYGTAATIPGAALGVPGRVQESFAREAFDPSDVIGKPLAWRHGEPIGVITAAHNQEDGLYVTAGILDTAAGRDADKLLRAGAVKGLSPGFLPIRSAWNAAKTAVSHAAARMIELSMTHQPAYAGAGVSAYREEEAMPDTNTVVATEEVPMADLQAREALADVQAQLAALRASVDAGGKDPVHPLAQYRDVKEYLKAVMAGDVEERALNVSALSEQTGMVPPTWMQSVMGVLDRGRPCINALGGPGSAGDQGLDIKWPTYDGVLTGKVGTTGGVDGTEVTSADIDILVGSGTLAQYSGANRLPYLVIDRAAPSYLEAYLRIMAGSFNWVTDLAFQTAMWANDTIATGVDYDFSADTTGAAFKEAVWAAAMDVEYATGQPAEAVFVDTTVFRKLAGWSTFNAANYPVSNTGGTINGARIAADVLGLPIVCARGFAVDESQSAIVTNRAALGWAEEGPRIAQADQPGSTSRDIAIYGYAVATPFIPAGIVSVYNAA
jgi:HK97 family phage prohead protease